MMKSFEILNTENNAHFSILNPKVLAPRQNLSLPLGRVIISRIIPNENVNNGGITREYKEKALDTSEKKESLGYLQNGCQKWVSDG